MGEKQAMSNTQQFTWWVVFDENQNGIPGSVSDHEAGAWNALHYDLWREHQGYGPTPSVEEMKQDFIANGYHACQVTVTRMVAAISKAEAPQ
jgi:hypothetical protein